MQQELLPAEKIPHEEMQMAVATPMSLIQMAVARGADIDELSKLMDLKERFEAEEARKAFVSAMADFKAESITVLKDKTNGQYDSKYVSLGNLVTTVTPFLSKHGLSVSWDIDQSAGIKVSCVITHKLGGSKSTSMTVPPDKSGSKNPIQEIKSAVTYAKACTFESACGLAATDANVNDDGNGAGSRVDESWLQERVEWIFNSSAKELQKIYAEAYKEARNAHDQAAMKAIINAKDARRKELGI